MLSTVSTVTVKQGGVSGAHDDESVVKRSRVPEVIDLTVRIHVGSSGKVNQIIYQLTVEGK